ncbi:MAG: type II toxin-antitoxin system RelE/ParE family toxin [Clostridiales bacterium]|nr:type II toxin-antitoxin system RelE/ParE family toxin [Clostridiales bacterium]
MYIELFKEPNAEMDVVTQYILGLESLEEQTKILALLDKIDEGGAKYLITSHEHNTKKIEDDMFEIKIAKNRFLYCYRKGNKIHIVHAFTKSTQKLPTLDKKLARKRIKSIS